MKEHNEQAIDLRAAFPEMPQDCRDALMRAARSVKEEKPVKKLTLRTALIAALILAATMTTALAVTDYLGWTDFYNYEIPKTAKDMLNATERKDYQAGPLTFTVNELMTDGHIALCSATARTADGSAAVTSQEVFDAIGANGENGRALAEKWGISPDTRWIDAARALNLPFYRVSVHMQVPVEYHGDVDMGDALWDENGNCVSYYMAALDSGKVGDALPVQLRFIVTQYDPKSVEPQPVSENVSQQPREINRWDETYEIALPVPAPMETKTYEPDQPFDFESGLTLRGVTAELTVAGAYVTGQFTLREGFDFQDAYPGDLEFLDEDGKVIEWGMAESGILRYDQLPALEWGAMLNLETLPREMGVRLNDTVVRVWAQDAVTPPDNH